MKPSTIEDIKNLIQGEIDHYEEFHQTRIDWCDVIASFLTFELFGEY